MTIPELKSTLISIADVIDEVKANFPSDFVVAIATFLESPEVHKYSSAASLLLNVTAPQIEKEIPVLADILRKSSAFFDGDNATRLSGALRALTNRPLILRLVAQLLQ